MNAAESMRRQCPERTAASGLFPHPVRDTSSSSLGFAPYQTVLSSPSFVLSIMESAAGRLDNRWSSWRAERYMRELQVTREGPSSCLKEVGKDDSLRIIVNGSGLQRPGRSVRLSALRHADAGVGECHTGSRMGRSRYQAECRSIPAHPAD